MARIERDSLGEVQVPDGAYYGAQTARAVDNFPISGGRPHPALVRATVRVKLAAARANRKLGELPEEIADAIERAALEVLDGQLHEHFVVDPYQAGAGTSHNMNVNEVLAARASELLGGQPTQSDRVHPNDHVNRAQSTNDVFPTALRLAAMEVAGELVAALGELVAAIDRKAGEFHDVVKCGRTHLQDAAPVRLGREVGAWAENLRRHRDRIAAAMEACGELGIGGTAVGTGLTAAFGYREFVVADLAAQPGLPLRPAEDLQEAMQSLRPAAWLSSAVRDCALDLYRISSDVRLLASGPATGLGELILPAVQPGSSIMPGKVNPSIAEMVGQVCARVIGCDTTVAWAAASGQLELNVFFPVAAHALLEAETILASACRVFARKTFDGLAADAERCLGYAKASSQLVLALSPRIGYARAAELVKHAVAAKRTLEDQAVAEGVLKPEEAAELLDPAKLAGP